MGKARMRACAELDQEECEAHEDCELDDTDNCVVQAMDGEDVVVLAVAYVGGVILLIGGIFFGLWYYQRRKNKAPEAHGRERSNSNDGQQIYPPPVRYPHTALNIQPDRRDPVLPDGDLSTDSSVTEE